MRAGLMNVEQGRDDVAQAARFFALAVDLFSVVGLDGVIRRINGSVFRLLGYQPADVVGRSVFDFVVPEDHDAVKGKLRQAAAGRETANFECCCRHRDGSQRWLACSCPPPTDGEDVLLVIARDVTVQKRLQVGLTQWKSRYDAAALATGSVVYEYDLQTGRVVWGSNLKQLLGYTRREMAGGWDAWLALIHPEDRPHAARAVSRARAEQKPAHLEYRIRRKDGTCIYAHDDVQFVRESDGSSARMIGCVRDISARKRAEEQFRLLVEAVPTGILLVDERGRITFANSRLEEQFGYAAAELIGQEIELLIPERFCLQHRQHRHAYVAAPRMRAMGSGLLLWGRHKDGREFPVDVALSPIEVAGQPLVVCTVVDLSERIGTQKALLESEQRLRDILDNAAAVMYVKDLEGRYLLINQKFEQLFGVARASAIGKSDRELFPGETAAVFRANDMRVLQTGQVLEAEEVVPHADGPHTYISVKFPLRDADSQIYALAGISTDITDRVKADQQVQQVRRRMELIVNSIADGIFGVDPEGRMTFVNPAGEEMMRWRADEVLGRHYAEILREMHPDGTALSEGEDLIRQAVQSGQAARADDRLFCRGDGICFPVEYRCTPIEEQGRSVGVVVTFHDNTERALRQQVEHELRAARRVQQRLYPQSPPQPPGFDLAGAAFPASQACGDYFDFIPLPNNNVALVVADVAGHGLGPALQMVQTRAYLRAMLNGGIPPFQAICKLNRLMLEDTPQEAFVTLFLAALDVRTRNFGYVGAGHDARLLRASGRVEELPSTGLVLGVLPDAPLQIRGPWRLNAGDILLILTDGVLEAHSARRELFGWQRTLDVVREHRQRPAAEIIQQLYQATQSFADGHPQTDDLTIVIAKSL